MAIVFIVALFSIKNKSTFKNEKKQEGLTYKNEILGNLVNKDTDLDGVLDWEEGLWGTDPTKKDTNGDGTPDSVEIEKLKAEKRANEQTNGINQTPENLTETDKFARELFSTTAALNQSGSMDQAMIEKISNSLAEQINNSTSKKVFLISDIKIKNDSKNKTFQDYINALSALERKYPLQGSVLDILAESMKDNSDINSETLNKLDPIIKEIKNIIDEMLVINVPLELAILHLDTINKFQKLKENLSDIKLIDTDIILAIKAVNQHESSLEELQNSVNKLFLTTKQKLKN